MIRALALFVLSAIFEIAGCFAFWSWLRRDAAPQWLVGGMISLAAFAVTLAHVDTAFAGRAFAAYGGIYIAASLIWLWAAEGQQPTTGDIIGAAIAVIGAVVIVSSGTVRR